MLTRTLLSRIDNAPESQTLPQFHSKEFQLIQKNVKYFYGLIQVDMILSRLYFTLELQRQRGKKMKRLQHPQDTPNNTTNELSHSKDTIITHCNRIRDGLVKMIETICYMKECTNGTTALTDDTIEVLYVRSFVEFIFLVKKIVIRTAVLFDSRRRAAVRTDNPQILIFMSVTFSLD
jgi:hypothetical protein